MRNDDAGKTGHAGRRSCRERPSLFSIVSPELVSPELAGIVQHATSTDYNSMTRKCTQIAQLVAQARPKFRVWQCYLYVDNPKLLLRGFVLDMPPGACYVWKFYFPLYVEFDSLHLTFAHRVKNGRISTTGVTNSYISDQVIRIIDESDDFTAEENVSDFKSFIYDERISNQARQEALDAVELYICSDDVQLLANAEENRRRLGLA